ncbi:hypothetical protein C5B42_04680 [Candidatus Cerribacteria bacterium 'Amazon FNV 2010 28 9']|uniref:Uncharacterized protein n=1 Tax=Candidatus Cerribacteria bacterium 'Amazon FNV 2010 28 9' TaxID=2081795 RepID=A0A317JMP9_9BACT|nr:MAG: hypothetical protein C5B42_04680 [Candidatus Cerribacteria bacterium 'Amazon FNV 2010 28 9']
MSDTNLQPSTTSAHPNSKKSMMPLLVGGAFVVVVVAGGATALYRGGTASSQTTTSSSTSLSTTTQSFKDGRYISEGDYMTHVGQKHLSVEVTLKDSVITDVNVTNQADDPMSVRYQDIFIANYKQLVVGKKITDIQLSKVAGSSLTPQGFNDALQKIEAQAKS